MLLPTPIHAWEVTAKEAILIQKQLANRIICEPPNQKINHIVGLDAAFSPDGKTCIAGAVVWDIAKKIIVEKKVAQESVHFPYIPGLLSFREAGALLAVLNKLEANPDALMCDGQGIAHPRRLGIASHLGILTDMITLGCAKSRLIGHHQIPGEQRGDKTHLMHKDEVIGTVLRTKNKTKPLFISVGNKIDLATVEKIVLDCFNGYRLPEPTRLADRLVADAKKSLFSKQ